MKVVVLGGGVIGVTSAYYLAKAGHEVTVVDRQPGAALETSFANAGEISPGYASPWAAPDVPGKALKWLFMKHAPLILRPSLDPAMVAWLLRTLRNCTSERYALNKSRMMRLAQYSRECLIALRNDTGIQYDGRQQGTLQLFRTQKQLDAAAKDVSVLQSDGVAFQVCDREGCVAAEPALGHVKELIVGGLRLPDDETGDCYKFTTQLAELAAGAGVRFQYGVTIQGFSHTGSVIDRVQTSGGEVVADAYVSALGSFTPRILKSLGLNIPVYPVKGYSITIPITDQARAPVSTVMDETYKVAITRLGDRIRVGGMAEVAGYDFSLPVGRRATLEQSVGDLFPASGDMSAATFWCGLRPMTPDGTPLVGRTRFSNLVLNTGHGTLGWTMACGSGRIVSDLVSGIEPEIEITDLGISRY